MGRPALYNNAEERREARRRQTREHVRAHRERRKAEAATLTHPQKCSDTPTDSHPAAEHRQQTRGSAQEWQSRQAQSTVTVQEVNLRQALTIRGLVPPRADQGEDLDTEKADPRPEDDQHNELHLPVSDSCVVYDFRQHSSHAPIDLSFGVLQAVLYDCRGILANATHASTFNYIQGADRSLQVATFAAAAQWVSRTQATPWLQINALEAYQGVRGTLQALNVKTMLPPVVVATLILTCGSLAYFETFSKGWQCKDWIYHFTAIKHIMQLAGPWTFRNPVSRNALRIERSILQFMACCERRHTFLDLAEWKTVPYDRIEQQDMMYYASALIPGILENCDILAQGKLPADEHEQLLIATLSHSDQCMDTLSELLESMDNVSTTAFLHSVSLESGISKFRAMCFMYMLILGCNIRGLRQLMLGSIAQHDISAHLYDLPMLEHYARQLCAVVHTILHDELEGTQAFHFFTSTQLVIIRQYHDLVEPSDASLRQMLMETCAEAEQLVEQNPHAEISRALGDWARLSRLLDIRRH